MFPYAKQPLLRVLFARLLLIMASVTDKQDDVKHAEIHRENDVTTDSEKAPLSPEEDGKVTLKTKLAVLSLIFMYEAYLFTLLM